MPDIKILLPTAAHPVFTLLLEPLLEPMDLLLQHVDPLGELRRRQLLLLVVAGAKGGTAPTAAESQDHFQTVAPLETKTKAASGILLPDKGVSVGWRRRHLGVVQVLLALSVGVEARGQHGVAVLLQQLPDQSAAGVWRQPGLLAVHALPLQR